MKQQLQKRYHFPSIKLFICLRCSAFRRSSTSFLICSFPASSLIRTNYLFASNSSCSPWRTISIDNVSYFFRALIYSLPSSAASPNVYFSLSRAKIYSWYCFSFFLRASISYLSRACSSFSCWRMDSIYRIYFSCWERAISSFLIPESLSLRTSDCCRCLFSLCRNWVSSTSLWSYSWSWLLLVTSFASYYRSFLFYLPRNSISF